jgi:hypothetical protein
MLAHTPAEREASRRLTLSLSRLSPRAAILLATFGLLNLSDLISTWVDLHDGMHEGNPVMSQLLLQHGFGALIAYKIFVVAVVGFVAVGLWSIRPRLIAGTLVACNLLILVAVVSNVWQYSV